jgi:hypothetical protein
MRIGMPAVPAPAVLAMVAGERTGFPAGPVLARAHDQVPHVKAYDCAHFQPQGR